jgi:hypothetical protein
MGGRLGLPETVVALVVVGGGEAPVVDVDWATVDKVVRVVVGAVVVGVMDAGGGLDPGTHW